MLKWYEYIMYVLFLVVLINFISVSSAITEKNFVEEIEKSTELTKYGKIEIYEKPWYDYFNWFNLKEKVKEIELKNNTERCVSCLAEGTITLLRDDALIEEVLFKRSFDGGNSWVNWNSYKNWKIYVENKERYKEVPIYETICGKEKFNEETKNYTQECEQVEVGKETIDTGEWVELKLGEVYPIGTYRWKLEGSKKPNVMYDWQLKTNGIIINEWAVWGNISEGAQAQVDLVSPENNTIFYNNFVNLVSSANITNGAYLVNATLYTNETGSWEAKETKNVIGGEGLVSYYTFDETSGDLIDVISGRNFTATSGVTRGQTDKIINYSWYFDGTNVNLQRDNGAEIYMGGRTMNIWVKPIDCSSNSRSIYVAKGSGSFDAIQIEIVNGNFNFYTNNHASSSKQHIFGSCVANQWTMLTVFYNETIVRLWKNSISSLNDTPISNVDYTQRYESLGYNYIYPNNPDFHGYIEEFSIWNRTLTQQEIQQLYNNGLGARPLATTTTTTTFTRNYSAGSSILWNVRHCDTDGDCGFALQNRSFSIDNIAPNITLNYPASLLNYGRINGTLTINITATDINLDKVWYNYNGTNITINGAVSGVWNISNITLTTKKNITIWANDTAGNLREKTFSWDYRAFETARYYNTTTYETKNETFTITIEGNLSTVTFNFNGFDYPTTKNGNNYSTTLNMELVNSDINRTFYWIFDNSFNSAPTNITIKNFILNYSGTKQIINFTIRDEYDNSLINSTTIIPNFDYYIDKGLNYNTFTNSTTIDRTFGFYLTPNISRVTLNGDLYYYASGYNPRYYFFNEREFTNSSLTNITLYLLLLTDGIVVRYRVLDNYYNPLVGAVISAEKNVGGSYILVEQTRTDDNGEASLFLNPNYYHRITITYSSCNPSIENRRVTSSDLTTKYLTCTGEVANQTNIYDISRLDKIKTIFIPSSNSILISGNDYTFGVNVSDTRCGIDNVNYVLQDSQGNNLLTLNSNNPCGETISQQITIPSGYLTATATITLNNSRYVSYTYRYYSLNTQNLSLYNITSLKDVLVKMRDEPSILESIGISKTTLTLLIFILTFGVIAALGTFTNFKDNEGVLIVIFALLITIFSYLGFINLNINNSNIYTSFINKYGLALMSWLIALGVIINNSRR